MRKVTIWAMDGGLGSGITGPIDVLAVANSIWRHRNPDAREPLFVWRVESIDGRPVKTATALSVLVDGKLDPKRPTDVVVLPGIVLAGAVDLQRTLARHHALLPALREQRRRGALIAANCGATFVLAESGLLDGRTATTSWWLARLFQERYPNVKLKPDAVLTEDDGLLCSGASTACLYQALRMVERYATPGLAATTAKSLLIDTRHTSQAPYRSLTVQQHEAHADDLVMRAQRWMERHLRHPIRLADLANDLKISERSVIRRFKQAVGETPVQHLQRLRIESAKRLLETTNLSLDQVCERVGYEDLSSFRRLFKREAGVFPRQYHERFFRRHEAM